MATTIDGPWCLAQPTYPNGPYFLSTAGETYTLGVNVVTQGTTFIVANTGITLDLAGYSITYCDRSPVVVPDGDFEGGVLPSGWDFSHAPHFAVVAASPFAHGSYMLQGTITTPEYFTTAAFTPTVYPYEYCACFAQKASNSGDTVKTEILLASDDTVLDTCISDSAKPSWGIWSNFTHKRTTGDALKLRITCTPSGASTFWIDWIQYLFSRDYGIYAARTNYSTTAFGDVYFTSGCPIQLGNVTGFFTRTLPSNFTLTDSTHTHSPLAPGTGLIVTGAGKPREGFVLNCASGTGTYSVDGVTVKAMGIDSGGVDGRYTNRLEIRNSKLECDIPAITNRAHTGYNIPKGEGSILVEDCTLLNNPNYGIGIKECLGSVKNSIQRNTITQRGLVTERYAIVIGQSSNIDVISNTINVASGGSGRGILIDDAGSPKMADIKDIRIAYNNISVVEKKNVEYGIDGLEVPGIRIRIYGGKGLFKNIEIDHNTILSETGATDDHVHGAYGIRLYIKNGNGYATNSNLFIHDNDITALCSRAPGSHQYNAAAISIDRLDQGIWPLFYNNDLESNDCSFQLGSSSDGEYTPDYDFFSMSNTHIKSASYTGLFTYASIGLGHAHYGTSRPVSGCYILDPKYSGGGPTTWSWIDTGWTAGMTGEILTGWIFTINGDVDAADITVTDAIPILRFTGVAGADGDLNYVPAPIAQEVHTKGGGTTSATLTPLSVQYETSIQSVTPTANQTLNFSVLPPVRLVFVRKS